MDNPWADLPSNPPYVLPCDASAILTHNARTGANHFVHLNLLPDPFLGRPNAPIVLLGLNPGYSEADLTHNSDPTYVQLCRGNLIHSLKEYPFYLLHPQLSAPGGRWWARRIKRLLAVAPRHIVAESILCVEYFPYHSRRYGVRGRIPSQEYGWHLVRQAVHRGALIIGLRSVARWKAAVPELEGYRRFHSLRSAQNVSITCRNLPGAFGEAVSLLVDGLGPD